MTLDFISQCESSMDYPTYVNIPWITINKSNWWDWLVIPKRMKESCMNIVNLRCLFLKCVVKSCVKSTLKKYFYVIYITDFSSTILRNMIMPTITLLFGHTFINYILEKILTTESPKVKLCWNLFNDQNPLLWFLEASNVLWYR